MTTYYFSNNWFDSMAKSVWDQLIPSINPSRILEIGSYEGASACYLIDLLASSKSIELHCVDTWEGGIEHKEGGMDMRAVEATFNRNIQLAINNAKHPVNLVLHKGTSDEMLARLVSENKKSFFDFIYIDGSHQASDVLCDAVLAFKLLKIGGVIAFDDYIWAENLSYGKDPLRCPKPAIDAFVNINIRKLDIIEAPLYQLYVKKLSD
jgi:predicted O-methyltransferase YrrM